MSISNIARRAEVSIGTISRVLNDKPDVNDKTRERVLDIIKKTDFSPRVVRKTKDTIGFFLDYYRGAFSNFYVNTLLDGIAETCFDLHLNLNILPNDIVSNTSTNPWLLLKRRGIDGGVFISPGNNSELLMDIMAKEGIPHVFLNCRSDNSGVNWIDSDNLNGGYKATAHLISLGHKEIAFAGYSLNQINNRHRLEGFKRAMTEKALNQDKVVTVDSCDGSSAGYVLEVLKKNGMPTAIFAADNELAVAIVKKLTQGGIKIPQDISIVGFDAFPIDEYLPAPLTAVSQPLREMGNMAVRHLNQSFHGQAGSLQKEFETKLIIRDSTRVII